MTNLKRIPWTVLRADTEESQLHRASRPLQTLQRSKAAFAFSNPISRRARFCPTLSLRSISRADGITLPATPTNSRSFTHMH